MRAGLLKGSSRDTVPKKKKRLWLLMLCHGLWGSGHFTVSQNSSFTKLQSAGPLRDDVKAEHFEKHCVLFQWMFYNLHSTHIEDFFWHLNLFLCCFRNSDEVSAATKSMFLHVSGPGIPKRTYFEKYLIVFFSVTKTVWSATYVLLSFIEERKSYMFSFLVYYPFKFIGVINHYAMVCL